MKKIYYDFKSAILVADENGKIHSEARICGAELPYSEENIELAKSRAIDGNCTIIDDGVEETATEWDKIDARLTYLEIMSGIMEGC